MPPRERAGGGPLSDTGVEPGPATGDPGQSKDERDQVPGQRAGRAGRRRPGWRRPGWRGLVATILIVLGCLLALVSVVAVWAVNEVADTGRYVANVEPLVHNPAVQNALTDKITNQITTHLNVTGLTDQAAAALSSKGLQRLGPLLKSFAPSLSSGVTGYVHSAVHKIVTGPRFAQAWVRANTIAHTALVKVLSGHGNGTVSISNGHVVVDLGPLINVVKQDLSARGFTLVNKLPAIHQTFTLFSATYLVKARSAYRLANTLKFVLPILALLLIGLGVGTARGHRRALLGAGLGLAASMLVLAVGLLIARNVYLGSVPTSLLPADAAAAVFDTFVRFIKEGLRTILVLGLVVAAGAFLTGPSAFAVRTRGVFASGLGRFRRGGEQAGLRTGPVGEWTHAHRTALRIGAVALAALVFVFWGQPTAVTALVITIVLLVVLGLIELIGRPAAAPKTAQHP